VDVTPIADQAVGVSANFLSAKCRVRADLDGWGSCATEAISAGETVAAFGGRCVSRSVLDEAGERPSHSVQIDDDLFIVTENGAPPGETIGHSCSPNCGIVGGILVVAMRNIAVGEILSYDHAMTMGCDLDEFRCACGSPACRRMVTGRDWMLPELQIAYRGFFSPYLAKRIGGRVRLDAERRAFAI